MREAPAPGEAASGRAARRLRLAALLLAPAVILLGATPSLPMGVRNWDNQVKLQVARNILAGKGPVLTAPTPDDTSFAATGVGGRAYPGYPILAFILPFASIASERLGGPVSEGVPALLLLALLAVLVEGWGRARGASPTAALAGALLVCLGTVLWPMAAHGYDVLMEAVALAALLLAAARQGPVAWLLAGLAVSAAMGTRVAGGFMAVPAAVLLLADAARAPRRLLRQGAAFALGCLPGVVATLWYNQYRFGSPLQFVGATGLGGSTDFLAPWLSARHGLGAAGLLVSPGKGLLWYSPPLLVALLLARPLWRRHRADLLAILAHLLVAVVLLGRFEYWHGDWAWGPRYVAATALAAAPLGWLVAGWAAGVAWRRRLAAGALAGAIALQAFPVVAFPVENQFRRVLSPLGQRGWLQTSPITRPPRWADHGLLYYRLDTSMITTLVATVAGLSPARAALLRRALAQAALAPLLALEALLLAARLEARRRPGGAAAPGPAAGAG